MGVTPLMAMPTQTNSRAAPVSSTFSTPTRLIRPPTKNDGANMPITCHCSTNVAAANGWWQQRSMASGVALMSRFITP